MSERIRVLYIDDAAADRELVRDALEEGPGGRFEVAQAASREEFEARLAEGAYDVILSDFNILGFEGLEVINRIRQRTPDAPVIIVTGTGSEEIAVEAMKRGAADYVIKTLRHIQHLPHTIQAVLKNARVKAGHKQIQAALTRQEAELRVTLYSIGDAVIGTDIHGGVVRMNLVAERLTGWSEAGAAGKPLDEVFHIVNEETRRQVENPVARVLREGAVVGLANHTLLISRDGREIPITDSGAPIRDAQGEITGVVLVFRDQSEERAAQKALRESEERFRGLYENATIGIYRTTPDGRILMANPALVYMLGYESFEELARRDLTKVGYEPGYPRQVFQERIERDGEVRGLESAWERKDGSTIFVRESARLIRDADGKAMYYEGTVEDITERVQAEERLQMISRFSARATGEDFFRTLVRSVAKALNVKIAFVTELVSMEPARVRTLAIWIGEELVENFEWPLPGTPCAKVVEGKTTFFTKDVQAAFPDDLWLAEVGVESYLGFPITDVEGHVIGHIGVMDDKPIHDPQQIENLMGIFADRAGAELERVQAEQALRNAQKLESLGILAGGIAHDFNNVLTAILGNIGLAKMRMKEEEPAYRNLMLAEKASLRARELTQQLLTFSKGGAPIRKTASIAELIVDSCEFATRGSPVRTESSIADDLWAVDIDEGQMSQVINNLAINAVQAMPGGGTIQIGAENVVLEEEASVPPLPPGRYVHVSVADEGIGIPEQYLSKIFDPYFTTKQQGSGLGLATSYAIVQKHEGLITVSSELGAGATFRIYLPASQKEAPAKPPAAETSPRGQGRVLVMDDEEIVRAVAGDMLRHLGYEADSACDGDEAVAMYRRAQEAGQPYDAVIMDLTIPGGMGGKEAIRRLLEIDPEAKVVVSSGYSNDPVMANFTEYGFRGVVSKPYRLKELGATLRDVIRS